MRRIRERYEESGYESMFDKRRGQPSPKRVPMATVEKVLALYRETYFDLNVRHFHRKSRKTRGIPTFPQPRQLETEPKPDISLAMKITSSRSHWPCSAGVSR